MNIRQYALKSFRRAGKGVIFMIALSSSLICAVLNFFSCLQFAAYTEAVNISGSQHVKYYGVSDIQAEKIKNSNLVDTAYEQLKIRLFIAENDENMFGFNLMYDEGLIQNSRFIIADGKAPEKINEIALSQKAAEHFGIECKTGTEFTMSFIDPDLGGEPINETFILSGIVQGMAIREAYKDFDVYVSHDFAEKYSDFSASGDKYEFSDRRDMAVRLKSGSAESIKEYANILAAEMGITTENTEINISVLNAEFQNIDVKIVLLIIIAVLMCTGAAVIYNTFNMIIARRIKHYGLLTLIGALPKQIRACVFYEALLNCAAAIPAGLVIGSVLNIVSLTVMKDMVTVPLTRYIDINSYIIAAVVTVAMTLLGTIKPAFKASRVVPAEAVRFAAASEKKIKRRSFSDLYPRVLAKINLKRNGGRSTSTIISLSLSGILFISVSMVGFSLFGGVDNLVRGQVPCDIQIFAGQINSVSSRDFINETFIEKIEKIDGIQKIRKFYESDFTTESFYDGNTEKGRTINGSIIFGVEDFVLEELFEIMKEGNTNLKDYKETPSAIAINNYTNERAIPNNLTLGQIVNAFILKYENHPELGYVSTSDVELTFDIKGIIDEKIFPKYSRFNYNFPILVVSVDALSQYIPESKIMNIAIDSEKEKQAEVAEAVKNLCDMEENISMQSIYHLKNEIERIILGITLLIMAVVSIIALIGFLNLISTTFISLEQRKREFGILYALGLDKKGLRKLLGFEGMKISIISILFSTLFGVSFGYLLCNAVSSIGAEYIKFSFPVIQLIVFALVYIFTPYIVTMFAMRRLSKETITQLIGNET